jgi:CheY-like chemotaxis protein
MQGTIGVESTVGVGTTFWIELLAAAPPQHDFMQAGSAVVSTIRANDVTHTRTLLYVEDNTANLKLVEMLFARRPDWRLLTAGTGDLGVEMALAHLPDLILMDINLPGISGIKVLSILRKEPATAHIPIIALSANARPRDIEKCLSEGFFRYVTKPIKVDELMNTLELGLACAATTRAPIQRVA